jgi:GrpB-like predicted nucleotidyltransferase (UPF0157 family)
MTDRPFTAVEAPRFRPGSSRTTINVAQANCGASFEWVGRATAGSRCVGGRYCPGHGIEFTDPDLDWPGQYDRLAARIRGALGWRMLQLEHVGSTAVPGLPVKPIIDIDLTVADPGREQDYVPALETAGFRLAIREPWWYGRRQLRAEGPRCNLHVFGLDSPEPVRRRIFRDRLRGSPAERDRYAAAKRQAAAEGNAAGEDARQYNARKQQVVREIYHHAFAATGLSSSKVAIRHGAVPYCTFGQGTVMPLRVDRSRDHAYCLGCPARPRCLREDGRCVKRSCGQIPSMDAAIS